jgi:hypothetical protein
MRCINAIIDGERGLLEFVGLLIAFAVRNDVCLDLDLSPGTLATFDCRVRLFVGLCKTLFLRVV